MKYIIKAIFLFLSLILIIPTYLTASTDIIINLDSSYTFVDPTLVEMYFERFPNKFFSTNDKIIPSGLALTNTLGYANGESRIKRFPHFEFGVAAGGGVLEFDRKDDYTDNNPTVPFGGLNGGFHLGTGITDRIDITLKAFFFSLDWISSLEQSFEGEGVSTSYRIDIDNSDVTSLGIKARYNLVKSRSIVPLALSLGGVDLNMGVDYMRGNLESTVRLRDTQEVELVLLGPVSVISDARGEGSIEWDLVSVTPEALVYIDFLSIFCLYTGPSASFNFGSFDFNVDASGDFTALVGPVTGKIGDVFLRSRNHMQPELIIPRWGVGLELEILALKFQIEGAAILTSITDSFTAQVGARMQL